MTLTNVSPVMNWAENAVDLERGFIPAVIAAFDQFAQENYTDLSILLTVTHGIKTDLVPVIEGERMAFATPLKRMLSIVMPSVTFKRDKAKASGVSYTRVLDADSEDNALVNEHALDTLRDLAERGATSKGDAFKAWLSYYTPEKDVEAKSLAEAQDKAAKDAKRLRKTATDNGYNADAYVTALIAELHKVRGNTVAAIAAE